jgi:16S rRNA (adenine1518-N6/adenine1519-N6)-dimethyltransferase
VLREETVTLLMKHGISLEAALDEQQLTNPWVINALIDASGLGSDEMVLEIGPGAGNITMQLAEKAKKVIAIEKNSKFYLLLKERFKEVKNVEIIKGDALKVYPPSFNILVSNLPYSIAEALLHRLFKIKFKTASVIISTNFSKIITATDSDPEYSKLSFEMQLFFDILKILDIDPSSYYPEPKISSSIIKINPREIKRPSEAVLRVLLLQRDRKLRNALRDALIASKSLGYPSTKKSAMKVVIGLNSGLILEKRVARLSLTELLLIHEQLDHLSS